MAIDRNLEQTLDTIAEAVSLLQEPWWVIGSAAAVLVGLDERVADVDLLTTVADARRLLARWKSQPQAAEPSPLFRSSVFGRVSIAPLPIEVMGGFHLRGEPVQLATRIEVPWKGSGLYVPGVAEQIALCTSFGRRKDIDRARRLKALL